MPVADVILSRSELETHEAGRALGAQLPPGSVVLLSGDLGAGKTAFVRGLAQGMGLDPDEVNSPTFTLIQEYRGERTLHHVDLYRLVPAEADDLGLEELTAGGSVVAIEWSEKLPYQIAHAIRVTIGDRGGDERQIVITRP